MGAFVPAVIPLFVHQHDVPDAEFQLVLAVRRVGHDAFESENGEKGRKGLKLQTNRKKRLTFPGPPASAPWTWMASHSCGR